MKKFLAILLSLILGGTMLAFAACSDGGNTDTPSTGNNMTINPPTQTAKAIRFPSMTKVTLSKARKPRWIPTPTIPTSLTTPATKAEPSPS